MMTKIRTTLEATILRFPGSRNKIVAASVGFYVAGLLLFFAMADWERPGWTESYWMWTMAKDTLFLTAIYLSNPKNRRIIFPILLFSIFRSVWEIIAQCFNKDANSTRVVDFLFYILLSISLTQILIPHLTRLWSKR